MKNIAVLDCCSGDSAKGRVAQWFSSTSDYPSWVIRANGSSNCGHMIYYGDKKIIHHLLPSADYRNSQAKSFLSHGMVINLEELLQEVSLLEETFPGAAKNIYVDPEAFVITESHIKIDKENNKHLMTTSKGVGPAYTDKVARTGTRIYHYIRDNAEIIKKLTSIGINFVPILRLRSEFEKSNLIFEGAQGMLLDLNVSPYYPFVTSSACGADSIYTAGFNFVKLDRVFGVVKPYLTKSGSGPMPSEMPEEEATTLRDLGKEWGNTTGRPRRIGYLDLPSLKYCCLRGGINSLIFTKMDILDGWEKIKVCHSYGKELYSSIDFCDIEPKYMTLPGWKDSKNLEQVKPFLSFVEEYVGLPVEYISCGVNKDDIIKIDLL